MLVITGGDPLARIDIYRLIEYRPARGLQVSITPSATPLVTHGALRRLRSVGINRLAISLDGADAATHDGIRGIPGIYDRTWDIIHMACDLQIPLQINTTLQPVNFDQIEALGRATGTGEDCALVGVLSWFPSAGPKECRGSLLNSVKTHLLDCGGNRKCGLMPLRRPKRRIIAVLRWQQSAARGDIDKLAAASFEHSAGPRSASMTARA